MNKLRIVKRAVSFRSDLKRGASLVDQGCFFSIFSRHSTNAWLLLFPKDEMEKSPIEIELKRDRDRFGDIWFAYIEGVSSGWGYLWKFDGPAGKGHLFDKNALLIDPYAKAISGNMVTTQREKRGKRKKYYADPDNMAKGIVCTDSFDWENDSHPKTPMDETIIYETHLKGFTAHPSANVTHPGTYKGIIEKIDYLKTLGITAVEFLPIHEFSAYKDIRINPINGNLLSNYWGYNTVGFFAPNGEYAATGTLGEQVAEFKEMVKALHKNGIEVILDVVFNHTAEGGELDKTFSFKGIDNSIYYLVDKKKGRYQDYTGCGNTVNSNHPVVSEFILDCLRYWVTEMHVDGFRFDLASALNRDENGNLKRNSGLIRRIEQCPVLRDTKIIAEAWDAAGAYQVGHFSGRWMEWNGPYRDDIRKFWRGDHGSVGNLATRLAGSSDLFKAHNRSPQHSVNFICSHDGFTMWDWASYNKKHNRANSHKNSDGDNHNLSINHGKEGETDNSRIVCLRKKQSKNLISTLMLSLGTPMILAGDEFLRTQKGNNNPYNQDNDISWVNWTFLEKNREIFQHVVNMIEIRKNLGPLFKRGFYLSQQKWLNQGEKPEIFWFDQSGLFQKWHRDDLALGVYLSRDTEMEVIALFNGNSRKAAFILPEFIDSGDWEEIVDTSKDGSTDYPIHSIDHKKNLNKTVKVEAKSIKLLRRRN